MSDLQQVTQFPDSKLLGNGNGVSFDARLRRVELEVHGIKIKLESCATKSDIDKLKIWALVGALAGTFAALAWTGRGLLGEIGQMLQTLASP